MEGSTSLRPSPNTILNTSATAWSLSNSIFSIKSTLFDIVCLLVKFLPFARKTDQEYSIVCKFIKAFSCLFSKFFIFINIFFLHSL